MLETSFELSITRRQILLVASTGRKNQLAGQKFHIRTNDLFKDSSILLPTVKFNSSMLIDVVLVIINSAKRWITTTSYSISAREFKDKQTCIN